MVLNKEQFVLFLYFCRDLFGKPDTTKKPDIIEEPDITWKKFQDVIIEENVRAESLEDRKGIKVTFIVSSDFVHKVGSQTTVLLEELKKIEACKSNGEVSEAKMKFP